MLITRVPRDASSHQTADHAISRDQDASFIVMRVVALSATKWPAHCRVDVTFNTLASTAKWRVVLILPTTEGIYFRGIGRDASHYLLFMLASAHSGGVRKRRRRNDFAQSFVDLAWLKIGFYLSIIFSFWICN